MKTDFSQLPREEIEARITTMLMGEMTEEEARELMEFVSTDAELLQLHNDLKATISLVAEASSATEQPILSEARREELLQGFKTVRSPELRERRNWAQWAAMAAMLGLLLGGAVFVFQPSLAKHKRLAYGTEERVATLGGESAWNRAKRGLDDNKPDESLLRELQTAVRPTDQRRDKQQESAQAAQTPQTRIELPMLASTEPAGQTAAELPLRAWYYRGDGVQSRDLGPREGLSDAPTDALTASPISKVGKDALAESDLKNSPATTASSSIEQPKGLIDGGVVEQSAEEPTQKQAAADSENGPMGAMGGGSAMSMQYYRSNPELMKRYFPQMYQMMTRGTNGAGNGGYGFGGYGGFGGSRGYGGHAAASSVAADNVSELKSDEGKRLADVAKKSELATASKDKSETLPADVSLLQSKGVELSLDERNVQLLGRAQQAVQQSREQQLSAGRGLKLEEKLEEPFGREMARRDVSPQRPAMPAPIPQPEVLTADNAFSTFSLNVSDVSFKLAAASLEKGLMPEAATVRSEEFINAFDYRDPEPQGAPIGFVWERARYPFAQDRDLVRFSVKTAASGREAGRPLNLVLLLDSSGSMERADRVRILQECLKTLAAQLRPEDTVSVVAFARTARLWVDGLPGSQANELPARVGNLTPEGGTNLEEAMKVAYETARKHFNAGGVNRVVLLTDGAANLGDVEPESLKKKVEAERKRGVALDCFGIGWEGLNDELLETLSRNGDGRYGFVNTPEAAASEFAGQLAGALHVAAADVKVQVEWNPKRVTAFRQIGYAKHQLTKEQFRDNSVDAAELGAAEAGNALYVVQVNAAGDGPLGTVRVRFKVPGTNDYREHAWTVDYDGGAKGLENSDYTMRLAGTASAFSEWLASSPYALEVTTDRLLSILSGVPEHFAPDPRPKKLEWMIRQAKSLTGK
jgi:Mg-chelatase subunit ChlD